MIEYHGVRITSASGAVIAALALSAAVATGVPAAASADTGGQATAYQLDAAHDGYQPDSGLTLPLQQEWSVNLGAEVSYPVVVGDTAYVSAGGDLYAIDLSTGNTLWEKAGAGLGPAYDDGQVFGLTGSGELEAVDPGDGTTNWALDLSSLPSSQYSFSGAPTAANGQVLVSGAGVGGTVYAINEATGKPNWIVDGVENGDEDSPAVTATGVYATYACDQDYDLNPAGVAGDPLWHYSTGCEGGGGATPAVGDGHVYGLSNISGNVILDAATGDYLGTFSADTTPAIADGTLYTVNAGKLQATSDGGLGTICWTFTGDGALNSAPVVAGDDVFVGSSDGNVYAVDTANGSQLWSASVGNTPIGPQYWNDKYSGTSGLAVADQALIVPAGNELVAYGDWTPGEGGPSGSSGGPTGNSCGTSGGSGGTSGGSGGTSGGSGGAPGNGGSSGNTGGTSSGSAGGTSGQSGTATAGLSNAARVAPRMRVRPSIRGRERVGKLARVRPGQWIPAATRYAYSWMRCNAHGAACHVIAAASGPKFLPTKKDVGHTLKVRLTATDSESLSTTAVSSASGVVRRAPTHV
jgi:outer membrane protein assembly factor BamB